MGAMCADRAAQDGMGASAIRVAVIVASLGRPASLSQLLARLLIQTTPPHRVILSVEKEQDIPDLSDMTLPIEVVFGPRGSSAQRNRALDMLDLETTFVAMIDDDYVPAPNFIQGVLRGFVAFPEASGLGGLLIVDGANGPGVSFEEAVAQVEDFAATREHDATPRRLPGMAGVYGCNMAFRMRDIGTIRFDEAVPLYGWLEDTDFGARLPGPFVYTDAFFGAHCAVKIGREKSGVRLGYSQVANPVHFFRKGTLSLRRMITLILYPFLANLSKTVRPEPWIDRKGRLRGNLMAFADMVRGRLTPDRILDL